MKNKELAEHLILEIAKLTGGFFAACGYTEEESQKNGHEVIDFISKYAVKGEDG